MTRGSRRPPRLSEGGYNWLDPSGHEAGIFTVRWQETPSGASPEHAVIGSRLVALSALAGALPPGAARVTPQERAHLRQVREHNYARRMTQ